MKRMMLLGLTFCVCLLLAARPQAAAQKAVQADASAMPADVQEKSDKLQAALQFAQKQGDAKGQAAALNAIGDLYYAISSFPQALEAYDDALTEARAANDREAEAAALNGAGSADSRLSQNDKAREAYQEALDVATSSGDLRGQAAALSGLGWVSHDSGQLKTSLDLQNRALPLAERAGDEDLQAKILKAIGLCSDDMGDRKNALDTYDLARRLFRNARDSVGEADIFVNIGIVYEELGEMQKAIEFYNKAVPVLRLAGARFNLAKALASLGNVYYETGELATSLDYHSQALPIFQQVGARWGEEATLGNIAIVYRNLGKYDKSLEYLQRSLQVCREIGDRDGEAGDLVNIGAVYTDLGENRKAVESLNAALPIYRSVGDTDNEATTMVDLGENYRELGENDRALDSYNQALPIFHKAGDRNGEAKAWNNIGSAYLALGNLAKALESYNLALPMFRETGNRDRESETLSNIAEVHSRLGQPQQALGFYAQALSLATAAGNALRKASIFHDLMLNQKTEQPALAVFYGKQAVNLVQQVRANIQALDPGLQKQFVSSRHDYFHDLANLLIDQGRLPEAQQIIDLMKEEQFKDFTRAKKENEVNESASLTDAEQKMDEEYQKETHDLIATYEQWSVANQKPEAERTAEEKARLAALSDQVQKGVREYEALLDKLDTILQGAEKEKLDRARKDVPDLASLVGDLDPGTVALYTLVVNDRYRVIVVRENQELVERSTPIQSKELRQLANRFVTLLSTSSSDTKELLEVAQRLYQILVAPVESDLEQAKAHTLVWELDDVLHYIPMAALYDGTSGKFLVEKYASDIISPESLHSLGETPDLQGAKILAMGLSKQYDANFGPLRNVPLELGSIVQDSKIADSHGVFVGTEWLDDDFTEKNLQSQLSSRRYRVVHIASHFNADATGDDVKSFLLLAGQDLAGPGFHLTLDEFKTNPNLRLRGVELLALSACKTAVSSQAADGHEIDGLGGVGQQLGARAVMASLWEVNDASTAQMMADFYRRWTETKGMTKAEALREAQLALLRGDGSAGAAHEAADRGATRTMPPGPDRTSKNAPYSHPYYWAPFILMGNWQ